MSNSRTEYIPKYRLNDIKMNKSITTSFLDNLLGKDAFRILSEIDNKVERLPKKARSIYDSWQKQSNQYCTTKPVNVLGKDIGKRSLIVDVQDRTMTIKVEVDQKNRTTFDSETEKQYQNYLKTDLPIQIEEELFSLQALVNSASVMEYADQKMSTYQNEQWLEEHVIIEQDELVYEYEYCLEHA
jgi:hypothetical protein